MHEHFLELVWSDHLVGNGGAVSQDNQRHAVEARYLPNYPHGYLPGYLMLPNLTI